MTKIFTLEFNDFPADYLLTSDVFDDQGNVVGQKSNEEFTAELEALKGKRIIQCTFTESEQRRAVQSPTFNPDDKNDRRNTYRAMMDVVGRVISQRMWPDDTIRLKNIENGRAILDGYPGDD